MASVVCKQIIEITACVGRGSTSCTRIQRLLQPLDMTMCRIMSVARRHQPIGEVFELRLERRRLVTPVVLGEEFFEHGGLRDR